MRAASLVIARSLSILGHPLIAVPAAVATLALHDRASSAAPIILAVCGVSVVVLAFSFWQVCRGRWQHVDASARAERRSLNLFSSILLFLAAAVAFYQVREPGLALGLFLSGLLIAVLMLVSPWVKISLHASFAAFAVMLLWPLKLWYVAIAGAVAGGVCWSRVRLDRHTVVEVVAGALLGALFGAGFWFILRSRG